MKKLFWILAPIILIGSFIILVIALTNNSPENPFREYRILVGLAFTMLNGLLKGLYKKLFYKKLIPVRENL